MFRQGNQAVQSSLAMYGQAFLVMFHDLNDDNKWDIRFAGLFRHPRFWMDNGTVVKPAHMEMPRGLR
jgi:hypothetical protein